MPSLPGRSWDRAPRIDIAGVGMNYILDRLKEGSTWRGLIMMATALGVKLEPDAANAIIAAGLAIIGVINVLRKQPKA